MNVLKSTPDGSPRPASADRPVPRTNRNSTGWTSEVIARSRSLRNLISSRRQTMLIARRSCLSPLSGTDTRIRSLIWLRYGSVTSVATWWLPPPSERHDVSAVPVTDRRLRVPDGLAGVRHEHVVQARAGHAHAADLLLQLREQARDERLACFHVKRHHALVDGGVEVEGLLEFLDGRLVVRGADLHPVLADAGLQVLRRVDGDDLP